MKSLFGSFSKQSGLQSLSDGELASAVCVGSQQAFSVLVDRYGGMMYRRAQQMLSDAGEAEEVVQVVLFEVYRNIERFDETKGSFKRWILKRTSLRALDRLRQLESQGVCKWTSTPEDIPFTTGMDDLFGLAPQECKRLVEQLMTALPAKQQQVVSMRFVRGLSVKEIQEETKDTIPTIRHLLYDGIEAMREALLKHDIKKAERNDSVATSRIL